MNKKEILAQKGNVLAQRTLGIWQAAGGLWYAAEAQPAPINLGDSLKWFQATANQDDVVAENGIGNAYFQGLDVQKDSVAAFKWSAKSAAHGYLAGEVNSGLCLTFGPPSIANRERGPTLLDAPADQGHFRAARNLHDTYFHGSGIGASRKLLLATYRLHRCGNLAPSGEKGAVRFLEALLLIAWFLASLIVFLILKRIVKRFA